MLTSLIHWLIGSCLNAFFFLFLIQPTYTVPTCQALGIQGWMLQALYSQSAHSLARAGKCVERAGKGSHVVMVWVVWAGVEVQAGIPDATATGEAPPPTKQENNLGKKSKGLMPIKGILGTIKLEREKMLCRKMSNGRTCITSLRTTPASASL